MAESILEQCATWCDAQAKTDWYGRTAGQMVREFAATRTEATHAGAVSEGVETLRDVIRCLRETGWYRDEEGESTNALEDLLAAAPSATLEWAVERWNAEVKNRPLVNVHRRPLDDAWRQVIRYLGGDDAVLLGANHSDLLAAVPLTPVADAARAEPMGYLPAYELSRLASGHDANLRSAKFGPSALDGDVAVYLAAPTQHPARVSEAGEDAAPTYDVRHGDDDDLRELIGIALSSKLYELMDNGKQAFDACDAHNIDMILDEVMPLIRPEAR